MSLLTKVYSYLTHNRVRMEPQMSAARWRRLNPIRAKVPKGWCELLKRDITHRLLTEDYTCRLPKPYSFVKDVSCKHVSSENCLPNRKPRIRYKLQHTYHVSQGELYWVYK